MELISREQRVGSGSGGGGDGAGKGQPGEEKVGDGEEEEEEEEYEEEEEEKAFSDPDVAAANAQTADTSSFKNSIVVDEASASSPSTSPSVTAATATVATVTPDLPAASKCTSPSTAAPPVPAGPGYGPISSSGVMASEYDAIEMFTFLFRGKGMFVALFLVNLFVFSALVGHNGGTDTEVYAYTLYVDAYRWRCDLRKHCMHGCIAWMDGHIAWMKRCSISADGYGCVRR